MCVVFDVPMARDMTVRQNGSGISGIQIVGGGVIVVVLASETGIVAVGMRRILGLTDCPEVVLVGPFDGPEAGEYGGRETDTCLVVTVVMCDIVTVRRDDTGADIAPMTMRLVSAKILERFFMLVSFELESLISLVGELCGCSLDVGHLMREQKCEL